VLRAVVTKGEQIEVRFVTAARQEGETEEEHTEDCEFPPDAAEGETECGEGPNPIMPELKELAWGAGSFIVFALLMRFFLFPRLKRGMDARYAKIRGGHEEADAERAAAKAEVADYEAALATVKAEANERIEAARRILESERAERLAEANARIAAKREAAAEATRAAREAARAEVAGAVGDVAGRTLELAIGRAPDPGAVSAAVDAVMGAGVTS
jgi:F-type H+-transporting ATPase subunit b